MTEAGPMRVLRVYHSGVVRSWRARDHELRRAGADVALLTATQWNEGGTVVRLRPSEGEVVTGARTVGHHPYLFVYDPLAAWRRLRSVDADLIDIHEEPASLAAFEIWLLALLARRSAPFCLYSAQNIDKRYPPPFRWIERFLLRRAAAVHTCNDAAGHILRRKGFAGIVCNLGLGVDVDRFRPAATAEPSSALRVGYVGRLEPHKGVDVLVDAVADVPDASLRIAGEGPSRTELEARIRRRSLAGRVEITGFVDNDDLPDFYRELDVLAVPSLDTPGWIEQFGRVAVEAMASGVAVVASASGSLIEVVGDAGRLVPPGDPEALARALRELSADERADLADRARRRAERWSWARIAERQLDLYRRMLALHHRDERSP